jgi:hypothetical protein
MGVEPTKEGVCLPTAVLKTEEPTRTQSLPGFENHSGSFSYQTGSQEAPAATLNSFGNLLGDQASPIGG